MLQLKQSVALIETTLPIFWKFHLDGSGNTNEGQIRVLRMYNASSPAYAQNLPAALDHKAFRLHCNVLDRAAVVFQTAI
jgi:hypothetical protein